MTGEDRLPRYARNGPWMDLVPGHAMDGKCSTNDRGGQYFR